MKSIEHGIGEKLDFHALTTEDVVDKLRKILEEPKYAKNAKELSASFRDQKEKPLDRAVWWAEWLIRNPDCDYIKSPVLRLGFIAGNSYDIIAVISVAIFVILIVFAKMCLFIIRKLFGSSRNLNAKAKQKQKKRN